MSDESEALCFDGADSVDIDAYCNNHFANSVVYLEYSELMTASDEDAALDRAYEEGVIGSDSGVVCHCGGDIFDMNADYGICVECGVTHWAPTAEAARKRANGDTRPALEDIDRLNWFGSLPPVI